MLSRCGGGAARRPESGDILASRRRQAWFWSLRRLQLPRFPLRHRQRQLPCREASSGSGPMRPLPSPRITSARRPATPAGWHPNAPSSSPRRGTPGSEQKACAAGLMRMMPPNMRRPSRPCGNRPSPNPRSTATAPRDRSRRALRGRRLRPATARHSTTLPDPGIASRRRTRWPSACSPRTTKPERKLAYRRWCGTATWRPGLRHLARC